MPEIKMADEMDTGRGTPGDETMSELRKGVEETEEGRTDGRSGKVIDGTNEQYLPG